ncbi:MAG: S4 domain-containing protein [Gammaproteobacteria bacterium]|nr:S4 domain-containing protein [Gammaproteobacteria bacterium]
MSEREAVRLDRWLWAARFYKTRAQAKTAIEGGKVQFHLNGEESSGSSNQVRPKVSKEVGMGDMLTVRRGTSPDTQPQTIVITAVSEKRGNATNAATLYQETDQSIEAREGARARRAMERVGLKVPQSKPSKRDRRALHKLKQDSSPE